MAKYQTSITELCRTTFDLQSLNAELQEQKRAGQVSSTQSPLVAFASILWARTELLADSIYMHTNKINTLENYLSRRNDSSSKVFLLQYVQSEMKIKEVGNPNPENHLFAFRFNHVFYKIGTKTTLLEGSGS